MFFASARYRSNLQAVTARPFARSRRKWRTCISRNRTRKGAMKISHASLKQFVQLIFEKAGCRPPEAERIGHYLVEANLVGHDSHGVIRVADYVRFLKTDGVRANQSLQIVF